jgi:hypothetical protein
LNGFDFSFLNALISSISCGRPLACFMSIRFLRFNIHYTDVHCDDSVCSCH